MSIYLGWEWLHYAIGFVVGVVATIAYLLWRVSKVRWWWWW